MSEANKELDALIGGGKPADDNVDWKQKYEALERELQTNRVEQGRLKKTNDELEAARRELSELRGAKQHDDLVSSLSEEERASIPDEVLAVATKLVGKSQEEMERKIRAIESRREEDAAATRDAQATDFLAKVDAKFPGFRGSITYGGDKANAWAQYLQYNRASIQDAFSRSDFGAFSWHVEKFFTDFLGVPVPSGVQDGSAAPDPANRGGGNAGAMQAHPGKTYSQDEFAALYDAVEVARDKGDFAEMARLNAEIKNAPLEGRVK